jgi:hypothetical protein
LDTIERLQHDHRMVEQLFRDHGSAAPDRPPALTLAAPVAAIYDRLRDRIQRRPRT